MFAEFADAKVLLGMHKFLFLLTSPCLFFQCHAFHGDALPCMTSPPWLFCTDDRRLSRVVPMLALILAN